MTDQSKPDRQEGDCGTYSDFKDRIGDLFCNVVNGVNGVISSKCGDLEIAREHNGLITLSKRAAELLTGIVQSPNRDAAEGAEDAFTLQTPMTNFALLRGETAAPPPQPAPDAVRSLIALVLPVMEAAAAGRSVQLAAADVARELRAYSSAPVPSPDGAQQILLQQLEARASCIRASNFVHISEQDARDFAELFDKAVITIRNLMVRLANWQKREDDRDDDLL